MASFYEGPVQRLVDELGRLPGIGPKSAQRIAYYLLKVAPEDARRLAAAIVEVKEKISWCRRCFNIAEGEECSICRDPRRDTTLLCVVEEPRDIVAIERTQEFRGRYHVLQGTISPIEGIGPDQLRVKELLVRIPAEGVEETILATNPNTDGEVTAMYLAKVLTPLGVKVTRIASGLPVGGDLEYADEVTLGRALEGRRAVDG
ncbi:MAG TPA: recombination mediator RecR [Acidimicrobiia bacterium]